MNVVCPSCQAPFEADDDLAGGPGLPLCDACSQAVRAPRPPAVRAAEPSPPRDARAAEPKRDARRRRPKAPDINFGPRLADAPPSSPAPESVPEPPPPSSEGEPISGSDMELVASSSPAPHDGVGLTADAAETGPVSLHDLGVVLGRAPSPPAWSGGASPTTRAAATPRNEAKAKASEAKTNEAKANEAKKPLRARPRAPGTGAKPSFFQVDAIPSPSGGTPADAGDRRAPDSGHEDLRRLTAPKSDRTGRRGNSDIFGLRGGLFADAPPKPPLLPLDLSALIADDAATSPSAPLAPVMIPRPPASPRVALEPPAPPEHTVDVDVSAAEPPADDVEPLAPAPPAPKLAPPPRAAPVVELTASTGRLRAPGSVAPGPVVAERRAAAARRGGIASWAVVVSVSAVIAVTFVVALRLGASSPRDPAVNEAASTAVATASLPSTPPRPVPVPVAPPPAVSADAPRERVPDKREPPAAPVQHAVEPVHTVAERPAPAQPPVAALPPVVAPPPVAAPPPVVAAPPAAAGGDFDQNAARVALAMAAAQAASCKQPDDPSGGARVSITFAPSGRAMSAQVVGAPFQGTKTGACIATTFRGASVPPFAGDPVTVSKTVSLR